MNEPSAGHARSNTVVDTVRRLSPRPAFDPVDRVLLYVRDPDWLYVWWEVTPASAERAAAQLPGGDAVFVVRLIDVDRRQAAAEHVVAARRGTYLPVPGRGRTYVAELGLRSGPSFIAVARSEPAFVPWGEPADAIDPRWEPRPALYELCLPERARASSPLPASAERLREAEG